MSEEVAEWVALRVPGCQRGFEPCKAIGVERDGRLIAGIVYHNWSPEAEVIEVTGAADDRRWMTREILGGLFGYPFGFCQMIIAQHDRENHIRRIWKALGADEYVIPRLRGRDRDGYIATITKEQWAASPFNPERDHGKTEIAASA
ncbi:MAG: N-acetyltransferase [Alphaproteobacteria bacterium]|nr:N-acetyltransferase [Alphaproteobacteria bacterium]